MASILSLPYDMPGSILLAPAADAAGRTGAAYFSVKNAHKAWIICTMTQGNAATIQWSPVQASATGGTGSKAITACKIWSCLDVATSDALVSQTAATSYTTDAAVKNKVVIFEIDPTAHMDITNATPFQYLSITTGASNAANITSAIILVQTRNPSTTPTTGFA